MVFSVVTPLISSRHIVFCPFCLVSKILITISSRYTSISLSVSKIAELDLCYGGSTSCSTAGRGFVRGFQKAVPTVRKEYYWREVGKTDVIANYGRSQSAAQK